MIAQSVVNLHYLPVVLVGYLIGGVVITYTISVSNGHVYYFFPYISDTGAEQPESGIFGYILNISTILFLFAMYVRYKHVDCAKEKLTLTFSKCWNPVSFVIGLLSCFGMNIVANYQELDMGLTHLAGAFLCYTCAIIYFFIQTKISYYFINQPYGIGRWIFMIRVVLNIFMIPLYFSTLWFGKKACDQFTGKKLSYWTPNDGGFSDRLISTFSEWLVTCVIMSYILTFVQEFRHIQFKSIVRLESE